MLQNRFNYESYTARFVGGTGRSGTSILMNILGFIGNVRPFLEPRFLIDPGGLYDLAKGNVNYSAFLENMKYKFRPKILKGIFLDEDSDILTPDMVEDITRRSFCDDVAPIDRHRRFIINLFSSIAQKLQRQIWVEKTPHTIKIADFLYLLFPQMRYVHIMREPKDIFASLLHQKWGPKSAEKFVDWYHGIMYQAYLSQSNIPLENYFVVSLENMIRNPEEMLKRIFSFLKIEVSRQEYEKCVSHIDRKKGHEARWKKELNDQQVSLIDGKCTELYNLWKERETFSYGLVGQEILGAV